MRARDEMQHQQRQDAVEALVGIRQRAGVADIESHARITVLASGVFDIDVCEIDALHLLEIEPFDQLEGQPAGAAANVQHGLAIGHADEVEERHGELPAPAAHQHFVAVGVRRLEGGGKGH